MSWKRRYFCFILRTNMLLRKRNNRYRCFVIIIVIVLVNLVFIFPPALLLHTPLVSSNGTLISQTQSNMVDKGNHSLITSLPHAEVRHIVFLKVHKAAGTTVMNIIMRFAISRNLSIMLPRTGNMFSQYNQLISRKALPSFHEDKRMFDVFCNHVIFNKEIMAPFFPIDTVYIGIVRQPFDQFVSAFVYYRNLYQVKYLVKIPGDNPIKTYLSDPVLYEAKKLPHSFTNNRMAFDFGYPGVDFNNMTKFREFLQKLDKDINFVMVVELFDESLILMMKLLKWHIKDIIYIKRNSFKKSHNLTFSLSEKIIHRRWAKLDYALYNHFKTILITKIKSAGPKFIHEVRNFRTIRTKVETFCKQYYGSGMLMIEESEFHSPFFVRREDCKFLKLNAFDIINIARQKHTARLDELGITYCPQNKTTAECRKYPHL
ncbi:galactose-3-O-sulfotransferase 2 [Patella vulgata]|uniref:galactose-3-O-sulfotransferase 2 n=1 Tax=Patella vulgata TaxID=6465 RepID=UPI0021806ADD|nr:galactose-3-O-sulfotransferase 2 [Patella vulgata]